MSKSNVYIATVDEIPPAPPGPDPDIKTIERLDSKGLVIIHYHSGKTRNTSEKNINVIRWIEAGNILPDYIEPPKSENPIDYPLTRVQFIAMLKIIGKEDAVRDAINSIPDKTQKALAESRFENEVRFDRDDALLNSLAGHPLVNITQEDLDTHWMIAKDL